MLEVLPVQSKIEQEALAARCSLPYNPDWMAYHALTDGILTGLCQFSMDANGGYIHSIGLVTVAESDTETLTEQARREALFVMGRAALNFIDLCGVHTAFWRDESFTDEGMIRWIGFKKNDDGVWEMELRDFFSEPCKKTHPCS